jgi:putative aldouronate transport system permease protein
MIVKSSRGDKVFDIFNIIGMCMLIFLTIYPFWYSLIGSLNEGADFIRGGVYLWPRKFTTANYRAVFQNMQLLDAFKITVARTILGTVFSVLFTVIFAYGFSRKNLKGRKIYAFMGIFTMFFSGGLIPYYMVIRQLGLFDSFLVYIIPSLFSFWNVIIFQAFFKEIPESIIESARIDGASEYRILFSLILPLSKPVIASIGLFTAVYHWNAYFDAMTFTNRAALQTLQVLLMKIVRSKEFAQTMTQAAARYVKKDELNPVTVQLATIMVATIPIVVVYPFLQKYFVKGIMIGSIKG